MSNKKSAATLSKTTSPYDIYWQDTKNWKWRLFYICRDDPRIIVPKKPKWAGRTLNFAHRKAFVVLVITILAITIPMLFLRNVRQDIALLIFFCIIIGIVAFYYCFDLVSRPRAKKGKKLL